MSGDEVTIDYDELEEEGDLYWLVLIDDSKVYFPKLECEIDEDDKEITCPEWLAIEKGLV